MATHVRSGSLTFADFLELVREDQKADLIDGVIYMASPESVAHNDLAAWLCALIRMYAEERDLGRVTINRVAYRLSDHTGPEPDVAFVRKERAHLIKSGYVSGPPDLAIEIVSPDSVDRDYEIKRRRYEESGVAEYWILDPAEQRATFLARTGDAFADVEPANGLIESRVISAFRLPVAWFWRSPLPNLRKAANELLGEN